jgi:pimeloyl-ACP methyl ester carboxylesterase
MEITRHVLAGNNLFLDSYRPITSLNVDIREHGIDNNRSTPAHPRIPVKLMAVGWSHGGILSRRLASRYPGLITDLVHITPAGYEHWGGNGCTRTGCLTSAFNWEAMRIGTGIFRGEGRYIFDAGWGVAKGMSGDTARSCGSCVFGNFHPLMPLRSLRDTSDCARYIDDATFPVPHLRNIVVLFGRNDSLFEYRNAGISKPDNPDIPEKNGFWFNYYRSAYEKGSKLTVKVLPGNHIAPLVHSGRYVTEALLNTDQLRDTSQTFTPAANDNKATEP